jgi:hypothetical protein
MDQKNNSGAGSAVAAGVAGAVIGAGVAVAATKVMSDKNMRDKVSGVLGNVKDQVMEAIDTARTTGENAAKDAQGKIDSAKNQIKEKAAKS